MSIISSSARSCLVRVLSILPGVAHSISSTVNHAKRSTHILFHTTRQFSSSVASPPSICRSSIDSSMKKTSSAPPPPVKVEADDQCTLLGTPSQELRLEFTLPTGQSFRWRELSPGSGEFIGVLGRRAVLLRQMDQQDDVAYRVIARTSEISPAEDAAALAEYFNLSINLTTLAETWRSKDPHFARLSTALPGARMLRQDPVECLFSFICSQNNHISRISGMIERLCRRYGTELVIPSSCGLEEMDIPASVLPLYAFPSLEQLSKATEEELREAGFGYRARYIVKAVQELAEKPGGGRAWLLSLRDIPFQSAVDELCTLSGVGPKVAACVALFSLDNHAAVPVDVHVWNLATKRYCPQLRGKTNTPKLHPIVQAAFVALFGEFAGWAHNTLFIGELASMKARVAAINDGVSSGSEEEEESESEEEEEEEEYKVAVVKKKIKREEGEEKEDVGGAVAAAPPVTPVMEAATRPKKRKAAVKAMRKMKPQLDALHQSTAVVKME